MVACVRCGGESQGHHFCADCSKLLAPIKLTTRTLDLEAPCCHRARAHLVRRCFGVVIDVSLSGSLRTATDQTPWSRADDNDINTKRSSLS